MLDACLSEPGNKLSYRSSNFGFSSPGEGIPILWTTCPLENGALHSLTLHDL